MSAVRHYHHHYHFSYKTSLRRHFGSLLFTLFVIVSLLLILIHFIMPDSTMDLNQISRFEIFLASFNTLYRMLVSYAVALLIGIPLALLITSSKTSERVFLPLFDIVQSVPVLAFFPVIVVSFVKFHFLEGASVFILVIAMLGSLVFSMIGGLKTIPEDISSAAQIYGAKGWKKLRYITLPAIFPPLITGSLLAWSQGWSIVIVAEALHTYIPHGSSRDDLFGLGSLLVNSFAQGKQAVFLTGLVVLISIITLLNYFVWQKLLHVAERFKFD